ncbi:unnamed protein product [Debaryomyces tyrocola]|nr:unnamed protein product [Debaryomyces tyrocola]
MTREAYLDEIKDGLYCDATVAKIWGVAYPALGESQPPTKFPDQSKGSRYTYRDSDWWTSGFFPGSIYTLLERCEKYPAYFPSKKINPVKLEYAAKWWAESMAKHKNKTDNHDLGFMLVPPFEKEYLRSGSEKSKDILIKGANSLASRFDERVGCIRSWDELVPIKESNNRTSNFDKDLVVIIDNMCNLNLLYLGAELSGDSRLSDIATTHAETTLKNHFREEWSSYHVVMYDRESGKAKDKFTFQGYADESSWTRGQAWGILGFTEAYMYTKDKKFLDVALNITKYYLSQLPEDGVPPWDFHAPDKQIRDVSSGMAAAFGMLKIYECIKDEEILNSALKLVRDCINLAYNKKDILKDDGTVELGSTDTILAKSTMINNPAVVDEWRIFDHGLVYADYYFLMIGNKLLELGLYN